MHKRCILGNPDHGSSELNTSKETTSKLVVAGGNPTKLLNLLKETFYQMAFLIERPVTFPRMLFVRFGRNAVGCTSMGNIITDSLCTICFVS